MSLTEATLRQTPLNAAHGAAGAKMVPFSGWEMPLQFGKVLDEHHTVRNAAGLFDISHMGLLSIFGSDSARTTDALNALVPQDLSKLYPGKAVYTQLLNPEGGILDDIIVYQLPENNPFPQFKQVLLICNAGNTQTVMAWLKSHLPQAIQIEYLNADFSFLALQGPRFKHVLEAIPGTSSTENLPKRFHLAPFQLGETTVFLSRTGYTGEDGVEIIVPSAQVEKSWHDLLAYGASVGLKPIGLAARDTLRLEAAYPLHGSDITPKTTPLEAGLGWSVKLAQPTDFIGKAALLAQQAAGLTQHFICFEVLKKSIPRHGDILYDENGNQIGEVTSGSISPTLDKPIGVGYVQGASPPSVGQSIQVGIRQNRLPAVIVERPFYRPA